MKKHIATLLLLSIPFACGGTRSSRGPQLPVAREVADETSDAPTDVTETAAAEPEDAPAQAARLARAPANPDPPPTGAEAPRPESEEESPADVLALCEPAQDKLIDIGRRINESIATQMEGKRKAWIKKCGKRVKTGDSGFLDDLRCVAESEDLDGMIRCDGWTDWPGM